MNDTRIIWRTGGDRPWQYKEFENLTRAFDFRRDLLQLGNMVGVECKMDGDWRLMGSGFATSDGDPYNHETYHGEVRE